MTDFARSMRQTELNSKLNEWRLSKIVEYYGSNCTEVRNPVAFEKYSNGYLIARPSSIEYVDVTTGSIFKLSKTVNESNWNCFNDLKTRLDNDSNTSVTIETPVHREVISGKEYTEISAPENSFGSMLLTKSLFDASKRDKAAVYIPFLKEMINNIGTVLSHAKVVADNNNCGITAEIFRIDNYWKDSNDDAFFTNCDKGWNVPVDQATEYALKLLETTMEGPANDNALTDAEKEEIKQLARDTWL